MLFIAERLFKNLKEDYVIELLLHRKAKLQEIFYKVKEFKKNNNRKPLKEIKDGKENKNLERDKSYKSRFRFYD
tara:strand:- start:7118 stop:7339 length:222 start_codon:yes stop_codon:yes gene_type:complete